MFEDEGVSIVCYKPKERNYLKFYYQFIYTKSVK